MVKKVRQFFMQKTSVTLSSKYQLVIPAKIRKSLKLNKGSKLYVQKLDEDRLIISKKPRSIVEELAGLGKEVWDSLGGADSYIRNERNSWDKELP